MEALPFYKHLPRSAMFISSYWYAGEIVILSSEEFGQFHLSAHMSVFHLHHAAHATHPWVASWHSLLWLRNVGD